MKAQKNFLEGFKLIEDVMKAVNSSMSFQLFIDTLEFFLFGLMLIFTSSIAAGRTKIFNLFGTSMFVHILLFQICYIGDSTESEVKINFFLIYSIKQFLQIKFLQKFSRKLYNKNPIEENEKFLDINLNITPYNCGLFKFNWELFKMVK